MSMNLPGNESIPFATSELGLYIARRTVGLQRAQGVGGGLSARSPRRVCPCLAHTQQERGWGLKNKHRATGAFGVAHRC